MVESYENIWYTKQQRLKNRGFRCELDIDKEMSWKEARLCYGNKS